ncbi:hypothetical protein D9M71_36660 [compost metagenome]
MGAGAEFRHPFTQGRHDNFTADDDRRRQGQPEIVVLFHQQYQRHRHHQLVRHRIEEGAEGRALLPATSQITVEPVGDGGDGEDCTSCQITPGERQIEQQDEDRNEQYAQNGEQVWNIHR